MKGLKAYIDRNYWDGIRIHLVQEDEHGVAVAQPLVMKRLEEKDQGLIQPPAISIRHNDEQLLQSIVDQAWDLGIRPRYARETTPEVNAVKAHLEDMRSLVFKGKGKANG